MREQTKEQSVKGHEQRMNHHLYSNEGRVEQCERIVKLEELARDLFCYVGIVHATCDVELHSREHGTWDYDVFRARMVDMGIEFKHE